MNNEEIKDTKVHIKILELKKHNFVLAIEKIDDKIRLLEKAMECE
jgi:hypothetical protein